MPLTLPLAVVQVVQWLGVMTAAAAAATAMVSPQPRLRAAAMLVALALVPVLLVGELWNTHQFRDLRNEPAKLALLAAAGVLIVAALTALFARVPETVPLALVAALPFRIPLEAGGSTANLLVPLYLVIAAAVIVAALRDLRETEAREDGPSARGQPVGWGPTWLPRALAAVLVVYALQSAYSDAFRTALENIVFFLVPFAIMFVLLVRERWTPQLLRRLLAVIVAEALVFAGIGFWEYHARELLWNPTVIAANQFQSYFRVNSVFWDPNIYGRYLVMVIVAVAAGMLWQVDARRALLAVAVTAVLWGGLVLTFSQSSFIALVVGLAALAAMRWSFRWTAALGAAAAVVAAAFLVAYGGSIKFDLGSEKSLDKATSGRADLIRGGIHMAEDRPVWGFGSGSFARTFRRRQGQGSSAAISASHTEPVTVAAEQGAIGLALYLALVVVAFVALLDRIRSLMPGFGGDRAPPDISESERARTVARAAVAAAFAALLVHTLTYAAFLADPVTWVLLAVGLGLACPLGAEEPETEVAARPTGTLSAVRTPA
jgi:O-antigen ligase